MKNLLNINSRNKVLRDVFTSFEQEAINALISITRDGTKAIVMREKVFNRFAKLNKGIKASRFIFTYKESLSEIKQSGHPFEVKFKSEIVYKTFDLNIRGKITAISQTILMFDVSAYMSKEYTAFKKVIETGYPVTSLEDLFSLHGSNQFINTLKLLEKNKIEVDIDFIANIYFEKMNESPTMKADSLANEYAESYYLEMIEKLSSAIFCYTGMNADLSFLYGVFLDLAKIDNNQFLKYVGGDYTRIPFFGKSHLPISTVKIVKHFDDISTEYELFIKGVGQVVHLVYDDYENLTQYHYYETSKKEKLNINGNEFCIDDDFLEGQHIDLLLMVLSDWNNVSVNTDIKYDYQNSIEWATHNALLYRYDDVTRTVLYEYLEQRGE